MSDGLVLTVGEYELPYPCDVRISREALTHPDTKAVIGHSERWEVRSYVLGASLGALKTAMDAVESGVAGGADVSLAQGATVVHLLDHSEARRGVRFTRPISFPDGGNAAWATNVQFTFGFEADFYDGEAGDSTVLWSTERFEYNYDTKGNRQKVWSGEIRTAVGTSAYDKAVAKSPGAQSGYIGPFVRIDCDDHTMADSTRANYEYTYTRGPNNDYEEFTQTLEMENGLETFAMVPLIAANPVRIPLAQQASHARQYGRKAQQVSYPSVPDPVAAFAGGDNANLLSQSVTREAPQAIGGTVIYTVTWHYEFASASAFEFPT